MKTVLVTGGTGQLGTELARYRWPGGWTVTTTDSAQLNLTDTAAIARKIAEQPWAAVINAAAYTAVDRAESDVVTAWQVNALAPAALAAACASAGIPLVHISTDYVFDGSRDGAWREDDPVGPLGVYGASKLGGELAVRTACPRHVILRTAWVVSAHGANFVKTMLRVGAERDSLNVVDDQRGSPTGAADLAAAAAQIAIALADDPESPTGTYHFSNAGDVSWYGFAQEIFTRAASRGGPSPLLNPITTAQYPTPARRPANSLLCHDAITRDYGIAPRHWHEALDDILDELERSEL